MNTLETLIVVILMGALLLPALRVLAWCLADVQHAPELSSLERRRWVAVLLLFNVVAIPAYVIAGPGRDRWIHGCYGR